MSNLSENDSAENLIDSKNKSAETLDGVFEARVQKALRASAESFDGYTQSRLTQARYAALEAAKSVSWTRAIRRWLFTHWIAPASGATAAAILAIVLAYQPSPPNSLQPGSDTARATATLDDLDMVASGDSLELYQEMDFYAWLDSQHSDDWPVSADSQGDDGSQNIT